MRLAGILLVAALAVAAPAAAQPAAPAPRPAPPPVLLAPTPAPAPAPRPPQSFAAGGLGGGLIGLQAVRPFGGGLVGLAASGDPAPQCRAACSKSRYLCANGGDDECDTRWTQCVAACRTAK